MANTLVQRITAGTAGAVLLIIGAADVLNPQYHPFSETVSRYVNGTAGWLIPAAILGMGLSSLLLHSLLRRLPGRRVGKGALALWTAGLTVAAVFPADPPGRWSRPSTSEMVHGLAAWLAFAAFPVAAVLLTKPLTAHVGRGRRWLIAAAAGSVLGTVALAVFMADVMDGPSLGIGGVPTLLGLVERLLLGANLAWIALAATAATRAPARASAAE
ncbi:DUF998 domain-containing protein [Micromonospora sp. C28SCA-DRY-2]|uniref:DUF998 domain-containing protein n=1 Tax=Micromonospora sp. C28SCA-DRY-2 TaxID=3059522 RepID=UPI002674740E|nr:DUF998 domain-containing protein [Micromonospora sp. C28SCA-DRY-2]MDO3703301.1 DUF998 domain-containing protein [Micromonospora sp. C28SCA-DRY-2]